MRVFLVLGFLILPSLVAHAQTAGIEISPAVVEDRASPGDTYNFTLRVTNNTGEAKSFYLDKKDIRGVDNRGVPIFAEEGERTGYELSSWVSLPQSSITLADGDSVTIPYTISVPGNATPGAHFGGIFVATEQPKLRETGAAVGAKIGSIISLRISGDIEEEARFREFVTDKMLYNEPVVDFEMTVENLGNVLLRPHGLVEVSDMFGKQVASLRVNETGASLFPKSDRLYVTTWEYDRFAFGRYQAVVSLVYGEDSRKTISSTTSFWVLPLKPILIALGSIFGFALLVYVWTRLYIRKQLRAMGVTSQKSATYYKKKYSRSTSRLMFITIGVFFFSVVFLFAIFLFFA